MSSTITTRDSSASYEDVVRTFREHDFTNPFGAEVLARTKRAFADYRAVKQCA